MKKAVGAIAYCLGMIITYYIMQPISLFLILSAVVLCKSLSREIILEQYVKSRKLSVLIDKMQLPSMLLAAFLILIFRVFIFNRLKAFVSLKWALALQAFAFGLIHPNIIQILYTTMIGFLFGRAMLWLKSLWVPVVIRSGMNITGVFISRYQGYLSNMLFVGFLLFSFIIFPFGIYRLYRQPQIRIKDKIKIS